MDNTLKRIRMREFEMNMKEFAEYLNVDYGTYRGWEKGRSQPPLEVAMQIAKKLNKKIEDIWQ